MLQTVNGETVFVVDFDTMPKTPIIGGSEERIYADALTDAIETGVITEPGKYGIQIHHVSSTLTSYTIFKIIE